MSILTKESDLHQFILQKCQSKIDIDDDKIVSMYSKVIISCISRTFEKLGLIVYCISCMETINNLFWIIFTYSRNLKLTMFLCDRAILLFNEYVIMTKTSLFGGNGLISVNLLEVKTFVYKKSIGPIIFNNEKNPEKNRINNLQIAGKIIYLLYSIILGKIFNINNTNNNNNNTNNTNNNTNNTTNNIDTLIDVYFTLCFNNIIDRLHLTDVEKKKTLLLILRQLTDLNIFKDLDLITSYNSLYIINYLVRHNKINSIQNNNIDVLINICNIAKIKYKKNCIKNQTLNININEFIKK